MVPHSKLEKGSIISLASPFPLALALALAFALTFALALPHTFAFATRVWAATILALTCCAIVGCVVVTPDGRGHQICVRRCRPEAEPSRESANVDKRRLELVAVNRHPLVVCGQQASSIELRRALQVCRQGLRHRSPGQGSTLDSRRHAEVPTPSKSNLHVQQATSRVGGHLHGEPILPVVDAVHSRHVCCEASDTKHARQGCEHLLLRRPSVALRVAIELPLCEPCCAEQRQMLSTWRAELATLLGLLGVVANPTERLLTVDMGSRERHWQRITFEGHLNWDDLVRLDTPQATQHPCAGLVACLQKRIGQTMLGEAAHHDIKRSQLAAALRAQLPTSPAPGQGNDLPVFLWESTDVLHDAVELLDRLLDEPGEHGAHAAVANPTTITNQGPEARLRRPCPDLSLAQRLASTNRCPMLNLRGKPGIASSEVLTAIVEEWLSGHRQGLVPRPHLSGQLATAGAQGYACPLQCFRLVAAHQLRQFPHAHQGCWASADNSDSRTLGTWRLRTPDVSGRHSTQPREKREQEI
mmetsp:Transcript_44029/g.116443  ORF Transcript_44029/g.116443 Transcript_44029/m.116443 type:complete len:528 (-) Transcript_44029:5-1588(-)